MAASGARVVGSLIRRCRSCCVNSFVPHSRVTHQVLARPICLSAFLRRTNKAAAGPEKFSDEYIRKQVEEFNIGKRHLANMMDEDPESFTQEDIDRSISYLFPSGLFEKHARPLMKHPDKVFPKQRAVQWGKDGRPFHFLFYTGKQMYYSLMHETFGKFLSVEKYQDHLRSKGLFNLDTKQPSFQDSRWLLREELEVLLLDTVSDHEYSHFIQLLEKLLSLPYASKEEEFIRQYRRQLEVQSSKQVIQPLQHDERGVAFCTGEGRRKTATATIVLRDSGSGQISINGVDYVHYFPILQDREQLMFPLHFMGMLGRFDLECVVQGGGRSSQAGALRLATSRALLSFLSEQDVEAMRQAGLLTSDPRVKERKKPGQAKARKKFTWKKR